MNPNQLSLEHRLLLLRDEIKALQHSNLPAEELKSRLADLFKKRSKLEEELLHLVVDPSNDYHTEAWSGLREGLLAAVDSLHSNLSQLPKTEAQEEAEEEIVIKPVVVEKRPGFISRIFASIVERPWLAWLTTAVFVYLLLLAVSILGDGFKVLFGGAESARQLFAFATNPFMGLLMGLLATAIIQSSSTTTSICVALCAAGLPIETAIPMIMGANIGTSITNTLVSLGHIGHRREFRRAFAAATVHDFFNMTAIAIFLPLEMCFGILEKCSAWLTGLLYGTGGLNLEALNFMSAITKPATKVVHAGFSFIPGPTWLSASLYVAFGLALIFFSILLLGKLLRMLLTGRAEKMFHAAVGKNAFAAICSGLVITVIVQSSSTTTSLIVPLAGAGLMKLRSVYPFTLGANIGTCITALLAAFAISGDGAIFGLQIAFVHLFFNAFGVIFIYGTPFLRRIPMVLASSLARLASRRRMMAAVYVVGVFFVLPLLCLGIYKLI